MVCTKKKRNSRFVSTFEVTHLRLVWLFEFVSVLGDALHEDHVFYRQIKQRINATLFTNKKDSNSLVISMLLISNHLVN